MSQLRRKQPELEELDVRVAIVSFEAGAAAKGYAEATHLPWPILVDEERQLYHAYGMLESSRWQVWSLKTLLAYARELWHGQKLQKSDADIRQRGGDVLIDPGGIVRLHHVGETPADRPSVEAILRRVRQG